MLNKKKKYEKKLNYTYEVETQKSWKFIHALFCCEMHNTANDQMRVAERQTSNFNLKSSKRDPWHTLISMQFFVLQRAAAAARRKKSFAQLKINLSFFDTLSMAMSLSWCTEENRKIS